MSSVKQPKLYANSVNLLGETARSTTPKDLVQQLRKKLAPQDSVVEIMLVLIDPKTAQWILDNLNLPNNRKKKNWDIGKMVQDMKDGRYTLSHQGVAFDTDGYMYDGQNRMEAVVVSGVTVSMFLFFNMPKESALVTDIGSKRSAADAAKISGSPEITNHVTATATRINDPMGVYAGRTHQQIIELSKKYYPAINWVHEQIGGKHDGVDQAAVKACLARAWYTQDRGKLARFIEVLKTGIANGIEESAACKLRDYLRSKNEEGTKRERKRKTPPMVYSKTQNALRYFLDGQPMQNLKGVDGDLFPLPKNVDGN